MTFSPVTAKGEALKESGQIAARPTAARDDCYPTTPAPSLQNLALITSV
jgi:hypothetical protein